MTTSPYTPNQVEQFASAGFSHDDGMPAADSHCNHELDATKRDRFEMLSAYLDGEATPEERQQILCWLQQDADTRCLYNRLLALRQGMRSQVCPTPCDAEATLVGVFRSLNHRLKLVTMATAGVIAISAINLLSGGAAGFGNGSWRMATNSSPESLQIALDQPAFPIPETSATPAGFSSPAERGTLPAQSDL